MSLSLGLLGLCFPSPTDVSCSHSRQCALPFHESLFPLPWCANALVGTLLSPRVLESYNILGGIKGGELLTIFPQMLALTRVVFFESAMILSFYVDLTFLSLFRAAANFGAVAKWAVK